jgi:hypothetical protein
MWLIGVRRGKLDSADKPRFLSLDRPAIAEAIRKSPNGESNAGSGSSRFLGKRLEKRVDHDQTIPETDLKAIIWVPARPRIEG